jgi:glycosyltransferase involved in cell wall biosynthesis
VKRGAILVVCQVFVPDPASVGQHIADAAGELVRRGHRVTVMTADRGYEDPSVRYPRREMRAGVHVHRLPGTSFGKATMTRRLVADVSFHFQCLLRVLTGRRPDVIVVSTSPPLIAVTMTVAARVRRVPVLYWAMDLNPDQLIALGRLRAAGLVARFLRRAHRFVLSRAARVVALDRFMAERLREQASLDERIVVLPPWPHQSTVVPSSDVRDFREAHGLGDAFVVMYSGNHSPSNPIDTLLAVADRLRGEPGIRFVFVGGGLDKPRVEQFAREHGLTTFVSLPYQPLDRLPTSLAAADVHVVTMGEQMVGVVHASKVYGALAASRPVLFVGPRPSHVTDLLERYEVGWQVAHGDVTGAVAAVRAAAGLSDAERSAMHARAQSSMRELGRDVLRGQFCDVVESVLETG